MNHILRDGYLTVSYRPALQSESNFFFVHPTFGQNNLSKIIYYNKATEYCMGY